MRKRESKLRCTSCHLSLDLTDGESNGTSAAYVVKLRLNQARQDTNRKEKAEMVYTCFF